MSSHTETVHMWRHRLHGTLVIVKKNVMLYYLRPPVLIFGVLFPVFFFLAFHLFILFYEEPTLRGKFGASYEAYLTQVPRWIPRPPRG